MQKIALIILSSIFSVLPVAQSVGQEGQTGNSSEPFRFRVNIPAGISIVSGLQVDKNRPNEAMNLSYGFKLGLNAHFMPVKNFEVGLGFNYMFPQEIQASTGPKTSLGKNSFIPVYASLRYTLENIDRLDTYIDLRMGYSFFQPDEAFLSHWKVPDMGNVQIGGFYFSLGLGLNLILLQYSNWEFSLDLAGRVDFSTINIKRNKYYLMARNSELIVEIGLGFRF